MMKNSNKKGLLIRHRRNHQPYRDYAHNADDVASLPETRELTRTFKRTL
ncbi:MULTISPECIES: hypothetical protein [Photorhabdus]|nr:hypothetical protein [Photorhabdus thracensis]MCC8422485.1 hypothetical protein [Photorhabdus thracensis]